MNTTAPLAWMLVNVVYIARSMLKIIIIIPRLHCYSFESKIQQTKKKEKNSSFC